MKETCLVAAKASSLLASLVISFLPDSSSWLLLSLTTLGLVSMEIGGATLFTIPSALVEGCWLTRSLSVPPIAADKPSTDSSGVTLKGVSILISSYAGAVGVNLPSLVEYMWGVSICGSPLFHSFPFKVDASSRATKLGVSSDADTLVDGTLFPSSMACFNVWYNILYLVSYFLT